MLAFLSVTLLSSFFSDDDDESKKVTDVKIVGLTGLSEQDVLDRLGGRLDFITSRPPSRSRADDADFLVSRILEKEGYSDVKISWKIPAERTSIVLTVTSGPRLTINDVEVIGADDEDADTMKQFFTGKKLIGGKPDKPYLADEVDVASKSAVDFLKAQGYWKATGTLDPPSIDFEKNEVNLTLNVNPGPLHKIVSLNLEGKLVPELPKLPKELERFLRKNLQRGDLARNP